MGVPQQLSARAGVWPGFPCPPRPAFTGFVRQLLLPACLSPHSDKHCQRCLGEVLWLSRRLEEQDGSLWEGNLLTPWTARCCCVSLRASRATLQIPLSISCLPRNCEIFTRRFRTGGLSQFLLLEPEK